MKIRRGITFAVCMALIVLAFIFPNADSQATGDSFLFDAYVKLDGDAEKAVRKAQAWLAETQLADGSWRYNSVVNTGVVAFATMALMVNGSVPGEGPYGKEIGKGLQFLLNSQKESGLIVADPKSQAPMYQHALATVALAEMYGMTDNPRIRSALINAVNLIVDVQHSRGGWRYQPVPSEGDISATVMQVMALRAASDAGIYVPAETIQRAIKFVKKCYNPKEKGFNYMDSGGPAAFARSGAGLVCLQSVGLYDDPIIPSVVNYIMENGFGDKAKEFYWYGHYYSSVGMYHYGGDQWKSYYPRIKDKVYQEWGKVGHGRDVLDTSWQILVLGVPFRYLPIYQR